MICSKWHNWWLAFFLLISHYQVIFFCTAIKFSKYNRTWSHLANAFMLGRYSSSNLSFRSRPAFTSDDKK